MNESGSPERVTKENVTSDVNITFKSDVTVLIELGDINSPYIIKADNETAKPYTVGKILQSKATLIGNNYKKTESTANRIKAAPSANNSSGLVVTDTTPLEVEKILDQKVEVGKPIKDIQIKGKDNGGGPLTHEVTGLPDGVTFDPETNTIKGTPTKSGEYPITVTTTDKDGNKTETKFKLFVVNPTDPENGESGNDNTDGAGGANDANNTGGNDGVSSSDTNHHLNSEKDTIVKDSTQSSSENDKDSKSMLPETGQEKVSKSLLGVIIAGIGSLLFFRRKKRNNE